MAGPQPVVYVSRAPATLAGDLHPLVASGPHVECVVASARQG